MIDREMRNLLPGPDRGSPPADRIKRLETMDPTLPVAMLEELVGAEHYRTYKRLDAQQMTKQEQKS